MTHIDRFIEENEPRLVTAKTPEEFAELRAWNKLLPGERKGPPPHTVPYPKRDDDDNNQDGLD